MRRGESADARNWLQLFSLLTGILLRLLARLTPDPWGSYSWMPLGAYSPGESYEWLFCWNPRRAIKRGLASTGLTHAIGMAPQFASLSLYDSGLTCVVYLLRVMNFKRY